MKRLMIFGILAAIGFAASSNAFFGRSKIREIKDSEERIIKEFLGIQEEYPNIIIPAPERQTFAASDFREVLNKEVAHEEAPGLSYGIYILNAINELNMVERVWEQEYKFKASVFFNTMLELNTGWSSLTTYIPKKLISGYSTARSCPVSSPGFCMLLRHFRAVWLI